MRKQIVLISLSLFSMFASASAKVTEENTSESDYVALETPLTFEAVSGVVTVNVKNYWCEEKPTIQYRVDGGEWTNFKLSNNDCSTPIYYSNYIPAGRIVQIRSSRWSGCRTAGNDGLSIDCDVDCYVYGNVMSLSTLDFATNYETTPSFGYLFYNNTHIKNHPTKELVLPSTKLSGWCYKGMFSGCTGLTSAPELPATNLDQDRCYQDMFSGCTNLNSVTCYATSITGENATLSWLKDVAEKGTFYKPSSMKDWDRSASGIPEGWEVVDIDAVKKCATPTISIKEGKVVFDCETAGVEYHYQIATPESVSQVGNNVPLPNTYTIKVYASKKGYEDSDEAQKELQLSSDAKGDVNGDGEVNATDIVTLVNLIMKR